jgi:hypothetical protein
MQLPTRIGPQTASCPRHSRSSCALQSCRLQHCCQPTLAALTTSTHSGTIISGIDQGVTRHAARAGATGVILVIVVITVAAIIIVVIIVIILQERPGVVAQQLPATAGWLTQPDTTASGTAPAVIVIIIISCGGCHSA